MDFKNGIILFSIFFIPSSSLSSKTPDDLDLNSYCASKNFNVGKRRLSFRATESSLKISEKKDNGCFCLKEEGLNQTNPLGMEMYDLTDKKKLLHVTANKGTTIYFLTLNLAENLSVKEIIDSIKKIGTVSLKMNKGWKSKKEKENILSSWKKGTLKPWQTQFKYGWEKTEQKNSLPKLKQLLKYSKTQSRYDPYKVFASRIIEIPEEKTITISENQNT